MGMPGKALGIERGIVAAEIVEQQERVLLRRIAEAEGPVQVDARALDMGLGGTGFDDGTQGDGVSFGGDESAGLPGGVGVKLWTGGPRHNVARRTAVVRTCRGR